MRRRPAVASRRGQPLRGATQRPSPSESLRIRGQHWYCLVLLILGGLSGCLPNGQAGPTVAPTSVLPHPSPTLLPTLESEAAELVIKRTLDEGMACEKPCLLSITPDQTTVDDAQAFYEHLGMGFQPTYREGDRQYYEAGHGFADNWGIALMNIVEDGLVRDLTLGISFVNYSGLSPEKEWSGYRPNAILERNGQPSAVEVFLSYPAEAGFPVGTAWYKIVMYFAGADLIAQYDYQVTSVDEKIVACPLRDEARGASFWLGKSPNNPPLRGIPLMEASGLSAEQFYDLLVHNSQPACLNLDPQAFVPKP